MDFEKAGKTRHMLEIIAVHLGHKRGVDDYDESYFFNDSIIWIDHRLDWVDLRVKNPAPGGRGMVQCVSFGGLGGFGNEPLLDRYYAHIQVLYIASFFVRTVEPEAPLCFN